VAAAQSILNKSSETPFAATASQPKKHRNVLPLDLVNSPAVRTALPVIGNVSYALLASGFVMTDMLTLRTALVGGYTGLVAFHALHERPLRIPLKWSALFIALNAGAAAMLIADRWCGTLSDEEEVLYDEHFSMLTRGQFRQLLALEGTREERFADGTRLTAEGEPCDRLYFVVAGECKLYLSGAFAKTLDEGSFVNDVAFQRGGSGDGDGRAADDAGAYGTVVTSGDDVRAIGWDIQRLRDHLEGRPEMDRNMRYCLTTHLVKGLLQQRRWSKDRLEEDGDGASGGLGSQDGAVLAVSSVGN